MKYLRLFETQAAYAAEEATLDLPNVSYIEENKGIHFKGIPVQPDNEIWYTTTDGEVFNLMYFDDNTSTYKPLTGDIATRYFGAALVSNTYENGKGVIKFNSAVEKITCTDNMELSSVFAGSKISSISLPNSIGLIENYGLAKISNCAINLPESLHMIEFNAFYESYLNCDIVIPDSTVLCGGAFFNSSMNSLKLGTGTSQILSSTFENLYLKNDKSLIIPSVVTMIKGGAFAAASITELTIEMRQGTIETNAFAGMMNLLKINYSGTMSEWNNIIKMPGWIAGAGIELPPVVHCSDGYVPLN